MPLSSSSFGIVRGDRLTKYIDQGANNAKYAYLKSFAIGKYNTNGESVTVTYLTNAPTGLSINTEYTYTFENDYETFNALYLLNFTPIFNPEVGTSGVNFDFGFIEPVGSSTFDVKFSTGIANRLGFDDDVTYTVTSKTLSTYQPITREPNHFVFTINGEKAAVVYPQESNEFVVDYPVFRNAEFNTPRVLVEDNFDNTFYVPCTFQVTYVDDYKDVDFRGRSISHYYCKINAPRTFHTILSDTSNLYAVKEVHVNDAQLFKGNEDVMVLAHRIYTLTGLYYINDQFQVSTTGTPLLASNTDAKRVIIAAYDYNRYVALPVFTASDEIKYDSQFTQDTFIPIPQQIPSRIPYAIPGLIPILDDNGLPIVPNLISSTAGPLGPQHYGQLANATTIDSVEVVGQNVTITGNSAFLIGFYSRLPQYVNMLHQTSINAFVDCAFGNLRTSYSFTSETPIGQRAPLFYQLRYQSDSFTFSVNQTNLIEWTKNISSAVDSDIDVYSFDCDGNEIRRLTAIEFVAMFLFRQSI